MDVQAAPPTLGQLVPGTTGGLPALSGLSVTKNPMAQELQSYGRGDDTMLVHMTPNEVNSLQGLAMASGGSLTINPQTGLPEAGWLGKLLPMIAGLGLNFLLPGAGTAIGGALGGIGGAAGTGVLVGGLTGAITGDLKQGLMAGLGAYGGASLGTALKGAGTAAAGAVTPQAATGQIAQQAGQSAAEQAAQQATQQIGKTAAEQAIRVPALYPSTASAGVGAGASTLGTAAQKQLMGQALAQTTQAGTAAPGLFSRFGAAAKEGLGTGMISKAAPTIAGMGVLGSVSDALQPKLPTYKEEKDDSYAGPYRYGTREARFPTVSPLESQDSSEFQYFTPSQPQLLDVSGNPVFGFGSAPTGPTAPVGAPQNIGGLLGAAQRMRGNSGTDPFNRSVWNTFAKGGEVDMRDGSFVVDARTVSELGNGSSNAGIDMLSKMGGRPVRGPGDGVSDSVPARIGGKQEARVARDEVIFPPEAVRQVGGGSEARGTKKLYALMDKAHKARRKSARGKDTGLRRGLA